jgi:hypothetical protein
MRNPLLGKEQLEASATDFVVRLAFLGPVVLSVFCELVVAWTRLGTNPPAASSDPEQP